MSDSFTLSDEERGILLELLRMEQRELPVEIHHARNSSTREDLHHRQQVVDHLLRRLQGEAVEV